MSKGDVIYTKVTEKTKNMSTIKEDQQVLEKFWMDVVIASMNSGSSVEIATMEADKATRAFKKKFKK